MTTTNWARTWTASPSRTISPATDDAVAAALVDASATRTRLKVVGAGHSWSAIGRPEALAMTLEHLSALDFGADRVTVGAGVHLKEIVAAAALRGLAMPILGSIAEQTVAGAISTATHGSSLVHGNLASLVTALRLVTPRGEVLDLDEADPRFAAARVGLGALGVITRVTLRLVPLFRLRMERQAIPVDEATEELAAIGRSAEYVKLWWLPHTDGAAVFRFHRTEEPADAGWFSRWLDERLINPVVFPTLLAIGRVAPSLIPPLNKVVAATYLSEARTVDRYDRQLTLAMPPRHRETEWAVPIDRASDAFRALRQLISDTGVRVNFICEARFVRGDDAWMSPAYGGDVLQLGAYMADAPGIDAYLDGFAAAMRPLGGRPHWGKETSVSAADVTAMWPRAPDFRALARELDPNGILRNTFLDRIL